MFVNKHFVYLKCAYLNKVKDVITRNLCYNIFYTKATILQDFHFRINVPLMSFLISIVVNFC